jgi:hypothetical protein
VLQVNDDEAERRTSRIVDNDSIETVTNLAEAADSLNNCLKLFAENVRSIKFQFPLYLCKIFFILFRKYLRIMRGL